MCTRKFSLCFVSVELLRGTSVFGSVYVTLEGLCFTFSSISLFFNLDGARIFLAHLELSLIHVLC